MVCFLPTLYNVLDQGHVKAGTVAITPPQFIKNTIHDDERFI